MVQATVLSTVWCSSDKVGQCYIHGQSGKSSLRIRNSRERRQVKLYSAAIVKLRRLGVAKSELKREREPMAEDLGYWKGFWVMLNDMVNDLGLMRHQEP